MRLSLAQIVFLVKPFALLEGIHVVGLRAPVVVLPHQLQGGLRYFLALLQVIHVEPLSPVFDPPESGQRWCTQRGRSFGRQSRELRPAAASDCH